MLYDVNGNRLRPYPSIIGDGIVDDTAALQTFVNTLTEIYLPANLTIRLTSAIQIDPNKLKLFDGGNCTFVCDGDINAFEVAGSLTSSMTANPSTLNSQIMGSEASFKICNCKITSANPEQATGIYLSGCFKSVIENCYIYKLKTGISIANQNRDLSIINNNIYGCWNYGIHIQSTVNLHQININGNMISYCYYCVFLDNPVQIANFQMTGNDIEISTYPTANDKSGFRSLYIASGNTQSGQLSEIEICGNTIQGHTKSASIIEIVGGTNRYVELVSIAGNHISNSTGDIVVLNKCKTVACTANTFKEGTYAFSITNCQKVAIVGNSASTVSGIETQSGTNTAIVIENNAV